MKCCVWCKSFGSSDAYTCGNDTCEFDAGLECKKTHWSLSGPINAERFQDYAKQAENCIDFEVVDELKEDFERK